MPSFRKLTDKERAARWTIRPCPECGKPYLGYLAASVRCGECKIAKRKTPEALQAAAAQYAVKSAIRRGELIRQLCEKCGFIWPRRRSHGHHEDYSKPLDVVWLCTMHHKMRHAQMAAEKSA